jgi:dihydrofolate synthase/folylpolyglutamate synthase
MLPDAIYPQTLAHLFARQQLGIKLGLEAMRAVCRSLGDPHRAFNSVLVAGTNGKGTTAALLAAALQHSGRRCGLYTSPHLLRFVERITIVGEPVTHAQVLRSYSALCQAEARLGLSLTFFEAATAMALSLFAEAEVDIAVLEVGLGGRLDATNCVDNVLSIITPIGMDHQALLGSTLAAIAGEKAGILRPGVPVVLAPQPPEARQVLRARAAALGCRCLEVSSPQALPDPCMQYPPTLRQNAATAWTAAQHLGVPAAAFAQAQRSLQWPGRYQWLPRRPQQPQVVLDGAHNVPAIEALVQALQHDSRLQGQLRLATVYSCVTDKDAAAMLALLATLPGRLFVCANASSRSHTAGALHGQWPQAFPCPDFAAAFAAATAHVGACGTVLVCGSLFLIGEALAHLTSVTADPPVVG